MSDALKLPGLPSPLVPEDCEVRRRGIPMPVDADLLLSSEWRLLPHYIQAARIQLMAWAWNNRPAGSLIARTSKDGSSLFERTRTMAQLVSLSDHLWKQGCELILAEFVLCSDGRIYHPSLCKKALALWMKKRVGDNDSSISASEWKVLRAEIFERDGYTCTYCGQVGGLLECDHITPRSRGGTNDPSNLTTACRDCNWKKRDRLLSEWVR